MSSSWAETYFRCENVEWSSCRKKAEYKSPQDDNKMLRFSASLCFHYWLSGFLQVRFGSLVFDQPLIVACIFLSDVVLKVWLNGRWPNDLCLACRSVSFIPYHLQIKCIHGILETHVQAVLIVPSWKTSRLIQYWTASYVPYPHIFIRITEQIITQPQN